MEKQFRIYRYDGATLQPLPTKNPNKLWWGFPSVFTLSKAEEMFANKPSLLKRLKSLKPGTILNVGTISLTDSLVIKVNEDYDQSEIESLEAELAQVNAEIVRVAGNLLKRQRELREKLKIAREK